MVPDNFLGIESPYCDYNYAKAIILPIPYEKTSSYGIGSASGPKAIIEASKQVELYVIETNSEPYLRGVHTAKPVKAEDASFLVGEASEQIKRYINDKKLVITLGGEHTTSIAPIKAYTETHKKLSILHLDAHSDRRDSYEDNPYSHASAMARVGEYCKNIVSVGIRSMDSSELPYIDKNKIFYAHIIKEKKNWQDEVVEKLTNNVYITIDLDVFDPSIMPSTGTPEPGGLGWYEVLTLMKKTAEKKNIVGFDVVELCPDGNKASDFLAAKLIYQMLAYIFKFKTNGPVYDL